MTPLPSLRTAADGAVGGSAASPPAPLDPSERARFFDRSLDLLVVTDFEGFVLAASPSSRKILGLEPGALVGRSLKELTDPEAWPAVLEGAERVLSGGELREFVAAFRNASGGSTPLRWSITADHELRRVYGVARDQTPIMRYRSAITDQETRFEAIFEGAHEGMLTLSPDGVVRRGNASACTLFDLSAEELAGRSVHDLLTGASVRGDGGQAGSASPLPGDLGVHAPVMEAVALKRDGSPVPVLLHSARLSGESGEVFLGILDLTKQKREEGRRKLEARIREEAEFRLAVAGELHDGVLQTLTAIGLQLEVATQVAGTDPEAARERLQRLAEQVSAEQRELRLYVNELKEDSGFGGGAHSPFAERVSAMLGRIEMAWGISTDLVTAGDLPAEETGLGRTMLRLVQESAVNAARHGGASHLSVQISVEAHRVVIRLRDDGEGFKFRGTYSDRELVEQRLGPVSLKRRVHRVGGSMSIRSSEEGARITFELPRTRRKERA